ncbi:MAG: cation-translocating P-type ATPase [Lachnospiraceae bacterium]|nr:cation-translocating P-type ATPase [Lachnospiraceae bacterium]MDY6222402.1 cation-translocating P-type ATPase [Candidatus Alectryocaccobium sp.]
MSKKRKSDTDIIVRRPMDRYSPDPNYGLTTPQAHEYCANGWDNRSGEASFKSTKEIIKGNTLTYFNMLFVVFAVLLTLVGSFRDLTFMVVIVANALIGIVQELNAKATLEKLTMLNAPRTKVLRDGKVRSVAAERLVLDDIVIFEPGNQISADAIVVDGEVSVNESLLTGESDEIIKRPGDPLMSGSFIVSGNCRAKLERVGQDSYISKLTLEAKASKDGEQSEMIRSINKLIKIIGVMIIPIGIILFIQQYIYLSSPLKDSVQSMVAAVIGMVPEGMYLLVSITLAVSTARLASKKVLVHDMRCIETLARVNVLCVDKTGTITENTMAVQDVIPLNKYKEEIHGSLDELMSNFAFAMSKDNVTMAALKKYFVNASGIRAEKVLPFSSAYKYSAAQFGSTPYVLGAPEFILKEQYSEYSDEIEQYSTKGYRVLVFGIYEGELTGKALTSATIPLCLILLSNPIRKDAKETFEFFADQGVRIKVISGDNPVTVSNIAIKAGIENAENYVDASTLADYDAIKRAVNRFTVFGRVTPEQKRMFVRALKETGNTVAMTGDGVNDVLALKDADCSVAMASGSDAAAQASQLVLLESDFARMPDVVMEGRQVVNNLERSGSLFLVKNIFSLIMSLFSIIFSISYPLEPSQLTLISMFTIGVPAFLLSQIPDTNMIKGHFMSNILLKALPGGLTDAIIVGAIVLFGYTFNISSIDISTASTFLLSIVGFMIVYQISKPMDIFKWLIWLGCILGLLLGATIFSNMFAITGMSARCIMLFVVFSILTDPLFRYLSLLVDRIRMLLKTIRSKFSRK